jgi:hypothetical protein
MAQNTWINVTADVAAARRPNPTSHVHTVVGGAAAAADMTISFDSAVVTNIAIFDTMVSQARMRCMSGGLK